MSVYILKIIIPRQFVQLMQDTRQPSMLQTSHNTCEHVVAYIGEYYVSMRIHKGVLSCERVVAYIGEYYLPMRIYKGVLCTVR